MVGSTHFIILAASAATRPYSVAVLALHLPRAVHLVAEAPELDAVRLLAAVAAAEVGQRGAAGMVAVLDQVARGIGRACRG